MPQTKPILKGESKTAKANRRTTPITETLEDRISELDTATAEEVAQDNEEGDAIIANTSPEKPADLKWMFAAQIERGGVTPLDFTNR